MMSEDDSNSQKSPPGAVESDPRNRYWRFEVVLGRGAFKTVFKAFDSREGTEVAWNKVVLGSVVNEDPTRKRLFSEIHVLKRLKHKNIMTFHDYWLDEKTNTLNFITELFTHGSLKKFRAKHKHLELKVLKKWAWQILQGLVYLHGHEPPIIHRDLKCDNILINGVTGDIKIGDLGLATLWKGLAPLSVIGTPEFMAPEFYDENYNEKVDVYAFGMLLLELVSMDYPYCECTNPAAIYKKVSLGVFPASIEKIRNEELRQFIELCIAYEPAARPEARKLLKNSFFDGIRKSMEPDRQCSEELDGEPSVRASESSSGSDSDKREAISRHGSTVLPSESPSEEEAEIDDQRSAATSDGVKIRIGCSKVEDEPKLHFTMMYARPEGVPKNIEFLFDILDDTADKIVAEMRGEEGSSDLDLLITEEEAITISELIASEVERWKVNDEGNMTAYVNVMRNPCTALEQAPHDSAASDPMEAREVLESKVDDMRQIVTSDSKDDDVFRAMRDTCGPLWKVLRSDSTRLSWSHKQERSMDEFHSDGVLTQTSVFYHSTDESQAVVSDVVAGQEEGIDSRAIDIPRKRRTSGPGILEHSHSLSSTMSDSRLQAVESGTPLRRSIQKHLSGRQSTSEGPSGRLRTQVLLSKNLEIEDSYSSTDSPAGAGLSPLVPVEWSARLVDSVTETENSAADIEGGFQLEMGQEGKQETTSLISVLTVKPPTKKGAEGLMPTVPELTSTQTGRTASRTLPTSRRKPDPSVARSKADEWQWTLANGLMDADSERSAAIAQQTQSTGASPQSSFKLVETCENAVGHGLKSPASSQDIDFCDRTDTMAPSVSQQRTTEGPGLPPVPTSPNVASRCLDEALFAETNAQCNAQNVRPGTERPRRGSASVIGHPVHFSAPKARSLTADSLDLHAALMAPRPDCRSAFDPVAQWNTGSIRAFRRDEGAAMVAGPAFHMTGQVEWPQDRTTTAVKQSIGRTYRSTADLLIPAPGTHKTKTESFFSDTTGFENVMHRSPSDAGLPQLMGRHPFPMVPLPINRVGSYHEEDNKVAPPVKGHTMGDVSLWTDSTDCCLDPEVRKQDVSRTKELRRQKASENIHKMQEQQLAGLCSGAAVGVASSKPIGGKSQRPSMNGSCSQ